MSKLCSWEDLGGVIRRARRILVLGHVRPDGDALGSVWGLTGLLRYAGKTADALLPEEIPSRYRSFAPEMLTALEKCALDSYDLVIALDCARASRIGDGGIGIADLCRDRLMNVDHHADNDVCGAWNHVEEAPATASLVLHLAEAMHWDIPQECASFLYLGLMTDTGNFRFSNTTPEALEDAAKLLRAGADLEKLVNAVFFSKPRNQQQFECALLNGCVRSCAGGRALRAVVPEELFERYHFSMRDGETVIDLLREIDGTVAVALLYAKDGRTKVSLRSKDARYPVGPLARRFGGGGHEMAAGITMDCPPEEADRLISGALEELLS